MPTIENMQCLQHKLCNACNRKYVVITAENI